MNTTPYNLDLGTGVDTEGTGALEKRSADRWDTRPLSDSILHLIWREQRISRADIAKRLGLSRSTVSELVKELLSSGFVQEIGDGISSGGRRPIVLEFKNDARIVLGVEIGSTHVSVVLMDMGGQVLTSEKRVHPVRSDPEGTRVLIIEICDICLSRIPEGPTRLLSIGVAVPSPVDPDHPESLSNILIPAWQGRNELERLNKHYGVPVFVDNDANLGALAEHRWGAGVGVADLCYIKIAYGLGAGFILQGEIYRGANGFAGEMGHLPVDSQGSLCVCGQRGCLVTLIGGLALEQRVKELEDQFPESILLNSSVSLSTIDEAAHQKDRLALLLIKEVAGFLGIAITSWINLMNPARVILGGSMSRLGDLLLVPIQKQISHHSLVSSVVTTEIRLSELGEQAESIGAATLALNEVFAKPHFYRQELTS